MSIAKLLPKKFGFRLFFMTLIAGAIPVVIFSILIEVYNKQFRPQVRGEIRQAYEEEWAQSEALLRKMGETAIRQKALDVAKQIDLTLQAHPYMTLEDLVRDKGFHDIAMQSVSETGYTSLHEADTGISRFHRDSRIRGKRPSILSRNFSSYWSVLKRSLGGKPASGYYEWQEVSGETTKKYMYIAPLQEKTADGIALCVAVSSSISDFTGPIKDAEATNRRTADHLIGITDGLFRSFRQAGIVYTGIAIWVISILAALVGIYFSRAITQLREATQSVNEGNLDVSIKPPMSGEVRTLVEDFNRMVKTLAETTVSKKLLEESEKKLTEANYYLEREIGMRKLTERALATEKEQLAVTLRSIGEGVITADTEGRIFLMNETAEKLTGWSQEAAQGRLFDDVFRSIDENSDLPPQSPLQSINQSEDAINLEEQRILTSTDGTERIVALSGAPIRDKENTVVGIVVVFRDITEKRKLEEELLTVRKLESVGTLAGGIAHDFNNLLAVILGNISFAKMLSEPASKVYERLIDAESATLRGKDLTYRLLTFSRGGEPLKRVMALKGIVKDVVKLSLSGSNVKCTFNLSSDLDSVEIDEGQIRQVIHNIVMNARESMPAGGKITVRAQNITLGAQDAVPLPDGDYVELSIADHGRGIAEEDLPRIFDPYFSTKEMGSAKGMGLGLAICFSIIKNHNGFISAESQPGTGTTIHVYLPALKQRVETVAPKEETVMEIPMAEASRGKILLMDDEEELRQVTGQMLRHLGFEVHFAADGAGAVEQYLAALSSPKPFEVVIMDLTIPGGMGGVETISELSKKDPGIRAIVTSGYTNEINDFEQYGFKGAIAKPFNISELSGLLDKIISGRNTPV